MNQAYVCVDITSRLTWFGRDLRSGSEECKRSWDRCKVVFSAEHRRRLEESFDAFTFSYIETALWSAWDNADDSGGKPLDENYNISDIESETLARMSYDCASFQADNEAMLSNVYGSIGPYGKKPCSEETAGHDFWLTRNGHGSGFWDGDYPEPHATVLTQTSKDAGEVSLYVGDDGKIYS